MALFDEPSKEPLPQAEFEDVQRAAQKALLSSVPLVGGAAAELMNLLTSPLEMRRAAWLEDLARRLLDLEGKVPGFRFDELAGNEEFISATLESEPGRA